MNSKRLLHRDSVKGLRASPGAAPDVVANPDTVTLTPAAIAEIRRQSKLRADPPSAIRVGLRGGGCSGYTYTFDWEDGDAREKDVIIVEDDITVFIDHRSMKLLKGTILDYHRTLMSQGFKFHNPNASGSCGCGESTSF